MPRLITLNLNHRTRHALIPPGLVDALLDLDPDILVLTEYVEAQPRPELDRQLQDGGLSYRAVSQASTYVRGRNCNQVLIASRSPVDVLPSIPEPPGDFAGPGLLLVRTAGMDVAGVRVPMLKTAAERSAYWTWLGRLERTDVLIGDFNADPDRNGALDKAFRSFAEAGGWTTVRATGPWSFRSPSGRSSRVDHVLTRPAVVVEDARYVAEPFVPQFTDHSALVVDAVLRG